MVQEHVDRLVTCFYIFVSPGLLIAIFFDSEHHGCDHVRGAETGSIEFLHGMLPQFEPQNIYTRLTVWVDRSLPAKKVSPLAQPRP